MIRKAQAHWTGPGKTGGGNLTTRSGALAKTPYGAKARFEDGPGTNPEELLAAAHAGCFTMALAFKLEAAGYTPDALDTEASVSLDKDGDGFKVSRSELSLQARIPGIAEDEFQRIADDAKRNCPVSKLFNAQITLAATLVGS